MEIMRSNYYLRQTPQNIENTSIDTFICLVMFEILFSINLENALRNPGQ